MLEDAIFYFIERGEPLSDNTKAISKLLFEVSMLKHTMRTGYAFLGSGKESAAAHSFNTAFIAYVLGKMTPGVDVNRMVLMALIHDIPEARTGDANAVHKRYITRDEKRAFEDAIRDTFLSKELLELYQEYEKAETREAMLVQDADQIDMLLSLREQEDCGNPNASMWIPFVKNRLKTEQAKSLADTITKTHWASWWMDGFKKNPS